MVRVGAADDALRSHSSRPMHAVWFAEDAELRDLAANLPLSIFEGGKRVDMPIDVSLESFCSFQDNYPSISPIHHLVQRQPRPVYRRCPPPYWQTQKYNNYPKGEDNESSQSDALWLLRGRLLFLGRCGYGVCWRIFRIFYLTISIPDSSFEFRLSWSCWWRHGVVDDPQRSLEGSIRSRHRVPVASEPQIYFATGPCSRGLMTRVRHPGCAAGNEAETVKM